MKKHILNAFTLAAVMTTMHSEASTDYWQSYLDSRSANSDLRDVNTKLSEDEILPNFSYAGYHFADKPLPSTNSLGYRVFNVVDYGATANDGKSDKAAFRKAISAAEAFIDQGGQGAIIDFPVGTFRLNEWEDVKDLDSSDTKAGRISRAGATIDISRGNMIIRGAGADTVLYMASHLDLVYPNKMWTSPYLIQVGYNYDNRDPRVKGVSQPYTSPTGDKFIALVDSDHPRSSTKTIRVNDASNLKVGQWIQLARLDNRTETIAEALSPYKSDASWKQINKGLRSQEFHQITHIEGQEITFAAVINHEVNADGYWGLKKVSLIEEVGLENLTIRGNWKETFKHHKSGVHDGGWSALRFANVANAFVRNVTFEDLNQGLTLVNTAAATLDTLTFTGNPGHISLDINASTHILASNIDDKAHHWHAAGFSHRAVGNVLTNSTHSPERFHNLHADMPYANLIENSRGGWNYGFMGGSVGSQPNHLKYLVFWNVTNTAPEDKVRRWAFVRHDSKYGRVIMPYVVGLKGWTFEAIESQQTYDHTLEDKPQAHIQTATYIDSLYQAQWEQRQCAELAAEPNLIGRWDLNGVVCDRSGNNNHGTNFSETIGSFNGEGERIELGDLKSVKRITLEFNYHDWNPQKTGFVISKGNYGTLNTFYVQVNKQGVLSARVNGKGINAGNFADGQWHTLEMSLSGNLLSLMIDGKDFGTQEVILPKDNTVPYSVGSTPKGTYPFKGQVRNVKLYK